MASIYPSITHFTTLALATHYIRTIHDSAHSFATGSPCAFEMPPHNIPEHTLATSLNNISVAGDDPVKIPLIDCCNAPVETWPVIAAHSVPDKTSLSLNLCWASQTSEGAEDLRKDARIRRLLALGVLLDGRSIEDEICLDQGFVRLKVEDQLLVAMAWHEFGIEFSVKLFIDLECISVLDGEDNVKADLLIALLGSLLWQALGRDDLGLGISCVPLAQPDVVLNVWGDDVLGRSGQSRNAFLHAWREINGREDGESARGEADYGRC